MGIIGIIFLIILFFVYIKNKNKKVRGLSHYRNNDSVSRDSGQGNLIENFAKPFLSKIDLNTDKGIFSHNKIRLKCLMAGIREAEKQKIIIFCRYAFIIPFSLGLTLTAIFCEMDSALSLVFFGVSGGVLGFFFPVIRLDSIIKNRQIEIDSAFPDFLDLMIVCVGAGMTPEQTYVRIGNDLKKFSVYMANEIEVLAAETTYFLDAKVAYDNFYYRTQNSYVKAFCNVVIQSIKFGTPLAQSLKGLSEEVREGQLGKIEKKAGALPSKLTVPMMIFTMPVLFVVILYPAIQSAIAGAA
jgi:tight adherence protein C